MKVRTVLFCPTTGRHWDDEVEPARCEDRRHQHQRFEVHVHRTPVTLPDGSEVTGASFDPAGPYDREREPAFGVYLDPAWRPPWPHTHVEWPDFGLPADEATFLAVLEDGLARARRGEAVEIGCAGGHGRTGTALAALAVLAGGAPTGAVAWVRAHYCPEAVETDEQQAFIGRMTQPCR